MTAESVLRKYEEQLMLLPNVTGAGIGEKNGEEVIIVYVKRKVPKSELRPTEVIPKEVDGYKTDVQLEIKVG